MFSTDSVESNIIFELLLAAKLNQYVGVWAKSEGASGWSKFGPDGRVRQAPAAYHNYIILMTCMAGRNGRQASTIWMPGRTPRTTKMWTSAVLYFLLHIAFGRTLFERLAFVVFFLATADAKLNFDKTAACADRQHDNRLSASLGAY